MRRKRRKQLTRSCGRRSSNRDQPKLLVDTEIQVQMSDVVVDVETVVVVVDGDDGVEVRSLCRPRVGSVNRGFSPTER